MPSVLLRNHDGRRFVDVTASSGTGDLHKGHGVAFADLDQDGNDEILFQVGGATPGDAHALRIFHNPGHGNDWINLKLVGVKTNRAALGVRLTVTVEHRGSGPTHHPPCRRERRLVRRLAAGAAHRPREVRADRGRGGLVADEQHAAAFRRRGEEPDARDQGVRPDLQATGAPTLPHAPATATTVTHAP